MTLAPGTRLGPYEIVGKIGAGGMGEVWKARDSRLGRDVAIKVLPQGFGEDTERLRRFEQEAKALAALNHPNILAVHDVGTHEGSPYLVMELLEGETLRELLATGALSIKRALDLALQMAHGLAAAHAKGLVHRDLKPANLFISQEGHLKILDFGLAKQATPSSSGEQSQLPTRDARSLTSEGIALGSVGYMSPEQVTGKPADARSDLFAFGVVLFEMLSGRRAFERASAFETLNATLKEDPPELESPGGPVPDSLQRLVSRCLEKDPIRRYQSAQDLVYDLESAGTEPGSLSGSSRRSPSPKSHQPRSRILAVAALILIAALGSLALWKPWHRTIPAIHIPSVVALPTKVFGAQESAFLTDAIPDTLTNLLAGMEGLDIRVPPNSGQVDRLQGEVARVAEAYRAEFLVLTTVTAEGDHLRLNVKLAEGASQKVRWASQYEGTRSTYTNLLQDAAQGLARALRPTSESRVGKPVFRSEVELALREGTYLQLRYARTKEVRDFDQALAAFRKAQALEPSSALLAAEIAKVFQLHHFETRDPRAQSEAERWAARALELDPHCGRAWAVRCWLETNRPKADPTVVVDCALKATRYAPNDANSYVVLGSVAPSNGFQAATGLRAMELDPLDPMGYAWAGMCLPPTGRNEEALAILERASRLGAEPGFHTWLKLYCLFHAGRFEEAKLAYTEISWPIVSQLMRFLMVGDLAGGRDLAQKSVTSWRQRELGSMGWVNRVVFYGPLLIRLGMQEDALWLLDKSADTDFPPAYDLLVVDPDLQKLRGDPRYTKALRASRNYALLFLKLADEARVRGEFPSQMEQALADLRDLVNRNP